MTAKMREAFQLDLPLAWLLEGPTVAQLAEKIEQGLIGEIEELTEDEAKRLARESE